MRRHLKHHFIQAQVNGLLQGGQQAARPMHQVALHSVIINHAYMGDALFRRMTWVFACGGFCGFICVASSPGCTPKYASSMPLHWQAVCDSTAGDKRLTVFCRCVASSNQARSPLCTRLIACCHEERVFYIYGQTPVHANMTSSIPAAITTGQLGPSVNGGHVP